MRPRVVRLTACTLAAAVLTLGAAAGRTTIAARHAESRSAACEDALSTLLELPLVWETDVKRMILKLREAGEVQVIGLEQHQVIFQPVGVAAATVNDLD
jgi:hypothetical protein